MTELLYHKDSYLKQFEAIVTELDGERLCLDQTAFYPRGGGQPCDRGMLRSADGVTVEVTEVQRQGGHVWHTCAGHAWNVGDPLTGELDWPHRYALMRTHTTLHALSAIIWREHAAKVTGGNMEPLRGRLDFELPKLPENFNETLEVLLNQELAAQREIRVQFLTRQEAGQIEDLVRTKVNLLPADITEIRTVEIDGLDYQADGGTHVANTREIGVVRIVKTENKGKGFKRVRIALAE
jgi:misacylated tRNA(Ala) deacylase